ncbi:hypothetical protein [Streptomyces sp. A0592]|uniref:hypothetical protein n=1 Tax=Streptomyces sp. A0592 TaxID=2563099 RepID=UPI00109E8AD8|nr:hypothetical protein [Streptomyces sp. A0592]THA75783.1 hypothetical protein E6U81_36035 [Streptomyces sp. A0592]
MPTPARTRPPIQRPVARSPAGLLAGAGSRGDPLADGRGGVRGGGDQEVAERGHVTCALGPPVRDNAAAAARTRRSATARSTGPTTGL